MIKGGDHDYHATILLSNMKLITCRKPRIASAKLSEWPFLRTDPMLITRAHDCEQTGCRSLLAIPIVKYNIQFTSASVYT